MWHASSWSDFCKDLQASVGPHLRVTLNNNRSTMLSVRWGRTQTRVSLHKMFLTAPSSVVQALADYLKAKKRKIPPSIKQFIGSHRLDYAHRVNSSALSVQGEHFHLQPIYYKLNQLYFQGSLDLQTTWFGDATPRNRVKVSLGIYYDALRLIKIHRLLDTPIVPLYVIEYIMYHEMLHSACPPQVNEKGVCRVHSNEFKEQEMRFYSYAEAKAWLKEHQKCFFVRSRSGRS